jgi:hypothetical protein
VKFKEALRIKELKTAAASPVLAQAALCSGCHSPSAAAHSFSRRLAGRACTDTRLRKRQALPLHAVQRSAVQLAVVAAAAAAASAVSLMLQRCRRCCTQRTFPAAAFGRAALRSPALPCPFLNGLQLLFLTRLPEHADVELFSEEESVSLRVHFSLRDLLHDSFNCPRCSSARQTAVCCDVF